MSRGLHLEALVLSSRKRRGRRVVYSGFALGTFTQRTEPQELPKSAALKLLRRVLRDEELARIQQKSETLMGCQD